MSVCELCLPATSVLIRTHQGFDDMYRFKPILTLLAATLLVSCTASNRQATSGQSDVLSHSSKPGIDRLRLEEASSSDFAMAQLLDLVANDFVNAMKQLGELAPSSTTVELLHTDNDNFTRALERALRDNGFGLRRVNDAGGNSLLQYRYDNESTSRGFQRDLYEVAIGSIEMRRTYLTDGNRSLSPVTPLYIRGADASKVELNDSVFTDLPADQSTVAASDTTVAKQTAKSPATASASTQSVTTHSLVTSSPLSVPPQANPLGPIAKTSATSNALGLPLLTLPQVKNVFELGNSNYESALLDHHIVAEQILTFANDSLRLGQVNKVFIDRLVEKFDERSDVFSVIGCSLGPTQLKSGNAALALGRAGRVKEALLFAGIAEANILDEGCWAGDSGTINMPRRGVVVTLKRKI